MLKITLLFSLIHFCLKEVANAQGPSGLTGGDVFTNNLTTSSAVHASSASPISSASGTMASGQPNIIANNPPTPEPEKKISNQGNSEDLSRSARGALISGFENTGVQSNLMGTLTPTGVEGPPGRGEGMFLGSAVASVPIGQVGLNQAIDVSLRPDGPEIEFPGGLVNPVLFAGMPEPVPNGLYNSPVVNSMNLPGMTMTNPSNTVLTNSITNGLTSPVYGELAQDGFANGLLNPVAMVNHLSNAGLPNAILTPLSAGPVNGLASVGISSNTMSATFPARSFPGSKSILASLTGIDPASLRTNAKFTVRSSSPMSPTGLTVQAENLSMQGKLAVTGKMPFLGSVTVDGVLPDGGTGTVLYECGNGNIGMVSEVNTAPVGMGTFNNFGMTGINPVNHLNGGFSSAPSNILGLSTKSMGLRNRVF